MILIDGGNEINMISFFTLFHFVSGFIARLIKIPLLYFIVLHLFFELGENILIRIKKFGNKIMNFEKKYLEFQKKITKIFNFEIQVKDKYKGDSLINSISDTLFATLGWIIMDKILLLRK